MRAEPCWLVLLSALLLHLCAPTGAAVGAFGASRHMQGDNSRGCACSAGYIGATCKEHVTQIVSYLPASSAITSSCNYAEVDLLKKRLTTLQKLPGNRYDSSGTPPKPTPRCEPESLDAYRLPAYGFGSIFSYAVYALHNSLTSGRMFEATPFSLSGFAPKSCSKQTFQCYLKTWSTCHGSNGRATYSKTGKDSFSQKIWAKVTFRGKKAINFMMNEERKEWAVPRTVTDRGLFWYHSQLTAYLWQLNTNTQKHVDSVAREIGYGKQCIGVHVRHGDACADNRNQRKCHATKEYMYKVRQMGSRYNLNTVYLATDDEQVVTDAKSQNPGYKFLTQPINRQFYAKSRRIEMRMVNMGGAAKKREGLQAVVDIELLARCDMFVGTFSTNLGRIAFEIMAARKGYVPPFESLDVAWCAGYAKKNRMTYAAGGKMVPFDC